MSNKTTQNVHLHRSGLAVFLATDAVSSFSRSLTAHGLVSSWQRHLFHLWAIATTMFRLIQTLLVKVSHLQRYGQQSGHFFVKRRGLVFMACLHRVKYLCMRPPTCTLFVCTCKHEYAPRRSGLSYCKRKRKKKCNVWFVWSRTVGSFDVLDGRCTIWIANPLIYMKCSLQFKFSFPYCPAPPSNSSACLILLCFVLFLSEYYIFADVSGTNCKVQGGGVAVKLRRRGKKEEPGHVWPRGQLWFYEMRAEARTQVDNVKLGFAACLSFNTRL